MGLHVSVYRCRYRHFGDESDCTNGGISAKALDLCLVNVEGPSRPSDETPAAMLVPNFVFGDYDGRRLVKVVPAEMVDGKWKPVGNVGCGPMMGGNYAGTSDGRFSKAVEKLLGVEFWSGAVPIHDRFE